MKIEHIAIWTADLEGLKVFYETYFQAQAGAKYTNPAKGFESYFLTFSSGPRLELMALTTLAEPPPGQDAPRAGYAHLAFSAGSRPAVDVLTARLSRDGYQVLDGPRVTGDGYYESSLLDPDGNRLEITI
jgi:lactoylglutathione lyase